MISKYLEKVIYGLLIGSRWLMAPLYLGLIAALLIDAIEFFEELVHAIIGFTSLGIDGTILAVLKLIDLVLIANLVLIMITAGIGTLTSIGRREDDTPWTQFMGKVDFSGLKLKVIVSLVAIASVDLLESFVEVDTVDKTSLFWQIAILATFVLTGVMLAWMDRLAETHEGEHR
jgi:uncharacterized protein (TIGR00645 family)